MQQPKPPALSGFSPAALDALLTEPPAKPKRAKKEARPKAARPERGNVKLPKPARLRKVKEPKQPKATRDRAGGGNLQKRLLEAYKLLSYRWVGKWFEREDQELKAQLRQADLRLSPGLFRAMALVAAAGSALLALLAAALAFLFLVPGAVGLALFAGLPLLAGASAWVAFPAVLKSRIQNRRQALDRELPFSISELSVLASIGLSPIALVRRMAGRKHDPAMTAAFAHVVQRVDTEGKDLVTALAEAARESASPTLREIFWDLANLVHQGGDLEAFLRLQSDHVLESLRATQTSFTEQLGTYADMYITIVLLGVMFVSVGAFMLNAFQSTAGGLSADGLVLLITYGFMPLVLLVLSLLLSAAYEKVRA